LFSAPYDKLAHSLYFATLSLLLWFGTGGRWPVLLFVAVSAIGGLDELHQATLPGRQAGFYDFLTDTVAAGLTITVLEWNKTALEALRRTSKA
jgi:VanZ family protein